MKSLAKQRKEQFERDVRDAMAFNLMLWFMLKALSGFPWKWGAVRLQRVYDAVLELMYQHRGDDDIARDLKEWGIEMGLTEDAFLKRKAARENGPL